MDFRDGRRLADFPPENCGGFSVIIKRFCPFRKFRRCSPTTRIKGFGLFFACYLIVRAVFVYLISYKGKITEVKRQKIYGYEAELR